MKKKSRSHLYDTNRPRLSQTHKHTKYKFFSHYNDANTYKQHVPEKVKLEKKNVVYKKACIYNRFPAEHHLGPPYDCFILHIFQNTSVWRSHVVMYESLWLTNFGKIISFR